MANEKSAVLQKAKFIVGTGEGASEEVYVQFNPTELTVTRNVKTNKKAALMKDTKVDSLVASSGGTSDLSVSLLFDSYSGYGRMGGPAKAEENEKAAKLDVPSESMEEVNADVTSVVQRFKALIRYEAKLHRPPTVEFIWGEHLDFKGVISSSSVHYTMFNPDGTPVRATISLSITGDEVDALNESKSKTFESPDRTKTRFLGFGEQLFMLADSEYGDPAKWKPIAAANDIMNPRLAGSARQMRVPSLR